MIAGLRTSQLVEVSQGVKRPPARMQRPTYCLKCPHANVVSIDVNESVSMC